MALIVEYRNRGEWRRVGHPLRPGDRPGSISHNGPGGRQLYLFGCDGPYSLILRSKAGTDTEVGELRASSSLGFEEVARLDAANPTFECFIKTDRMRGSPVRFRFRHE